MDRKKINITASHPVEYGQGLGQFHMAEIFGERIRNRRIAVVTDREISGLYLPGFLRQFEAAGFRPYSIIVDGGQVSKSIDTVKTVYEGLTDAGFGEADVLFALGGGGVMDVAGFAAATFLHGIDYIQVPTSLLAMVDSSVSPFAFLNFQSYKDRIAVKNKPFHTIVDTTYLSSLPPRYLANGIARIIQFGLTGNVELLTLLMAEHLDMEDMITKCLETRFSMEKENLHSGLGEEIASAIEGHFRFLKYTHGEALALGILAMFPDARLQTMYQRFSLPVQIEGVTRETLLKRVIRDLATAGDEISFLSVKEPGKSAVQKIASANAPEMFDHLLAVVCP